MIRLLSTNISANLLPVGKVEPLELCEIRGVKRNKDKNSEVEFRSPENELMDKIQVIRSTKAVVSNQEARFEIVENEILVPLVTKGQCI